jgi:hypothetical protein
VRVVLSIFRKPSDPDRVFATCSCGHWEASLPRTTVHVLSGLAGLWRIHVRLDHPGYE